MSSLTERAHAPLLRRKCGCSGDWGSCASCSSEKEKVIRRSSNGTQDAGGPAAGGLLSYLGSTSGQGRPLDGESRSSFESSLGMGLGGIRIHADGQAASAAASLGAKAFTLGSTIWFGQGQYRPGSPDGRRLLAHEVAHAAQQQGETPQIQREVIVGAAHDPAEHDADRAADAMLRGEKAAIGGGAGSVLRRECTADSTGQPSDQWIVTCTPNGQRWRVNHHVDQPPPPGRQPNTEFNFDWVNRDQRLGVRVRVCRGGTNFVAELTGDFEQALMPALMDVIQSRAITNNVHLTPYLAIVVTQSQAWQLRLEGGPTIGLGTGNVQQVGVGAGLRIRDYGPFRLDVVHTPAQTGPGGTTTPAQTDIRATIPLERNQTPIPRVDCSRVPDVQPRDVFECRRITPRVPGRPPTPAVTQNPYVSLYVLYQKRTPTQTGTVVTGYVFSDQPSRVYTPNEVADVRSRVQELVLMGGFLPAGITGNTSPEGERVVNNPPPGRFRGNDPLSMDRARRAQEIFDRDLCFACPTYEGRTIVPIAAPVIDSELYNPPQTGSQEPRGAPLETHAINTFLAIDPLRPRTPQEQAAFAAQTHAQQTEAAYSRLRRAEIWFQRSPIRIPADRGTPDTPEGLANPEPCPPEVEAPARARIVPIAATRFLPGEQQR